MKRSRFSEEQIIGILREHEAGSPTADVCRKHGVSSATFYTTLREVQTIIEGWRQHYNCVRPHSLAGLQTARCRGRGMDVASLEIDFQRLERKPVTVITS